MAGRPQFKGDVAILSCITQQTANDIYHRIERGVALWKVAESVGVTKSALVDWLEHGDRIDLYKRARMRAASAFAEQAIEIADGKKLTAQQKADQVAAQARGECVGESPVARDKLRIQSRQWLASRWDRATYGESQQPGVTVNFATLHLDALRRLSGARHQQQVLEATLEPTESGE